ncbi:MAG: sulfatase-like hydrolase/transferase [Oscillospiraceae bacterium]|nr:sulfatase-like hydrolase/transferase [Oscillospiraceae bacterium]
MNKRPHIIIFNPDEMRADTLGHLGNAAAVTPNLDSFAATEAVSFRNAYCQNPVCVPSRCSFFTGLYPHTHGHRTMSYLLRPGESTLFKELKEAGYYVWMNDRNDLTAGQISGWTESHATEIYYGGQKKQGPGLQNPNLRGKIGEKNYYSHFEGKLQVDENGINYNGDDEVVDAAIQRILDRPADQPLCMFLGLIYPHTPYRVEEPYFSAIDRTKLPKRIRAQDCADKAKILDEIRSYANMQAYTEEDWNELRAVYQGMCMKVDAQFKRLTDALKQAGIYDDCAIFVLSDHGDFAGDYDLIEKCQNSFEDCLTRVPLLIKPPKGTDMDAGVSDSLVELVDFFATAMDFADVTPSYTHFGRSLRPVLKNRAADVREYVFCEGGRQPGETHCDEYHQAGPQGAPKAIVYWPKMMAQAKAC